MSKYAITGGIRPTALKVVIYGPEGIGKTTFASCFPKAVFIDTEGSTKFFDLARFPVPTSWAMLLDEVQEVINEPSLCDTLVIDTADWAEKLCIKDVCASSSKKGIEDFGYGKGYTYTYEAFAKLLHMLEDVANRGVNVVLTAHAALRKFEQPDEMGAYDRWELKLLNSPKANICAMVKEWADMVIFANYQTFAVASDDSGKKFKAQGGKRVMYLNHNPCWDAKNRFGLPDGEDFLFGNIASVIIPRASLGTDAAVEYLYDRKRELIEKLSAEIPAQAPVQAPAQAVQASVQTPVQTVQAPVQPPAQTAYTNIDKFTEPAQPPVQAPAAAPPQPGGIPKALADLMRADGITENMIQKAVASAGHFPEDTPIKNYGDEYINGFLVGQWQSFVNFIRSQQNNDDDLPF